MVNVSSSHVIYGAAMVNHRSIEYPWLFAVKDSILPHEHSQQVPDYIFCTSKCLSIFSGLDAALPPTVPASNACTVSPSPHFLAGGRVDKTLQEIDQSNEIATQGPRHEATVPRSGLGKPRSSLQPAPATKPSLAAGKCKPGYLCLDRRVPSS